jgi:glucosamine-6-phosphate deaminase
MQLRLINDSTEMARAAADHGAQALREAIRTRGAATVIVATGMSQLAMLEVLVRAPGIDWSRVTVFHLDEYIGLPSTHPASFRRYLRERFLAHLPAQPDFTAVDGDAPDLAAELARLNGLLEDRQVDLCFAGVGENGHLAFNDPPADFEIDDPYIAVDLDEACRRQQLGEGWFPTLADVPQRAISMSIRQIMRSQCLLLTVPELRKAQALRRVVEGPVEPTCPASIIQNHPNCIVYLDSAAASQLRHPPVQAG